MASEEMSFENDDGLRMPGYTISSHMSLRLRWAENENAFNTIIVNTERAKPVRKVLNKHIYNHDFLSFFTESGACVTTVSYRNILDVIIW